MEGIAAKRIDETVFAVGVYESNGVTYYTGVLRYSLGTYCERQVTSDSASLAELSAAIAVYGYYAKVYFAKHYFGK